MPESKKSGIDWKMVALNVLGIVGCYLLFQLINALLIAKEAVGEGRPATRKHGRVSGTWGVPGILSLSVLTPSFTAKSLGEV